jgi:hypothetical protein
MLQPNVKIGIVLRPVAARAERDQIVQRVVAKLTSLGQVMHLQIL